MREKFNLAGQKIGRLTVLKPVGKDKQGCILWECICDCGNKINVRSHSLRKKITQSCGCLKVEAVKKANTKHGFKHNRFYRIWSGMKTRCDNPNVKEYTRYGGRGIKYQESWKEFINFKNDMYESYCKHCNEFGEKNTSIERKDNNNGYTKDNCKWATRKEQQRNNSYNKIIKFKGKEMLLMDAAKKFNIPIDTLSYRLKSGWNTDKALNQLVKTPKKKGEK